MLTNKTELTILTDQPVFLRKLTTFLGDYALEERPALVWQARLTSSCTIDLANNQIGEAFRAGVPAADSWCGGFKSYERPSLTFEGLASFRDPEDKGWVAELHEDGHIIAGLWRFPQKDAPQTKPYLFPWHAQIFIGFGQFAAALYTAAEISAPTELTATMLNAKQFGLSIEPRRLLTTIRPISRAVIQWPLAQAASPSEMESACSKLALQFKRIFGLPNSKD